VLIKEAVSQETEKERRSVGVTEIKKWLSLVFDLMAGNDASHPLVTYATFGCFRPTRPS